MAKQQQDTEINAFYKGLNKSTNSSFTGKDVWTHARNAINNSLDGDLGLIGNEPANKLCANVPYTIIGAIHKIGDEWFIFSTDDNNSEIGLFDDNKCTYTTILNAKCLNFKKLHLITGASKENHDCTWQVYWDDGFNPSRTLNIDNIPYRQIIISAPGAECVIYQDTTELDCEELRLAPLLSTPCLSLTKAEDGGQLRNGSYQAFVAYTVNEQRVTDYIGMSNIQSLFDHSGIGGGINITVTNLDKKFDYYELVILSTNQQNSVAKRIGLYSTEQSVISIDYINQDLESIPLSLIPLRTPAYERSDNMFVVNDYLIRQGPREQFDFNYQPLANFIKTEWVVGEYPANYYYKGGNKTNFMRDEVYAFFIRWIYNTGERSSSYHIPGRAPKALGKNEFGNLVPEAGQTLNPLNNTDNSFNFNVYNFATVTQGALNIPLADGGTVIAKGEMAYWQSTERYPNKPDIWGPLCGKPIRHHKMPIEHKHNRLKLSTPDGEKIRILGVQFSNIAPPVDNDGNIIPNIVGYEILRGSREGNKSILAKGIFRNMRKYDIPEDANVTGTNVQGLYPNYPFNDLRDDIYFHDGNVSKKTLGCEPINNSVNIYKPLHGYTKDVFTFHSPDLMFKKPFLNVNETRMYHVLFGRSEGQFIKSENHPQFKLIKNTAAVLAGIVGVGYAIQQVNGKTTMNYGGVRWSNTPGGDLPGSFIAYSSGILAAAGALNIGSIILDGLLDNATDISGLYTNGAIGSQFALNVKRNAMFLAAPVAVGTEGGDKNTILNFDSPDSAIPSIIRAATGLMMAGKNIAIGAQEVIDLFYNLVSFQDYAYKYNAHGFYNNVWFPRTETRIRSKNIETNYVGSSYQQFTSNYKINNLFRPKTVVVNTADEFEEPSSGSPVGNPRLDNSRFTIGSYSGMYLDNELLTPEILRISQISALYGALKFNFQNQYGQLDGIKQIPMKGCINSSVPVITPTQKFTSDYLFSGDTYIGRYTEKVIMPIFTDFLNGQPDGFPYDYLKRINIPYPRFWIDSRKFDTTALAQEILTLSFASQPGDDMTALLPDELYYLDRASTSCEKLFSQIFNSNDPNPKFSLKYTYMYTHVNGIQDFFVESEINLAQRDWDDAPEKRHYDVYEFNNVSDLFHADIIKLDNYYKYDYSLSAAKFLTNLSTFGNIQPRDYDPSIYDSCYTYYPDRLLYSLQAQTESKKDYWKVFLTNNYRDFRQKITTIKSVNKTGAIIFFPYQSPQMFQGVDELQTSLGTKLTIGDGGLFNQPFQNIVNSDLSNEYGSAESARSVVNTPFGLFFISQAQGKIFHYAGQLRNIANDGLKQWFNNYLPSTLIRQFPEIETSKLADNPVIGIGCQTVYDAVDSIVYFTKKDYVIKDVYLPNVEFNKITEHFIYTTPSGTKLTLKLGDPLYFKSTSWTVSYDPKAKAWISFHDWHPELVMHSINHFITTKTNVSDKPQCPAGYNYNGVTNKCEKYETMTTPAPVQVTQIDATIVDDVCSCPEGYTLVYLDGATNQYTLPSGPCSNVRTKCRKVECPCPEAPFEGSVVTETGQCDDLYLTGSLGYINPLPKICSYFSLLSTGASYELGGLWRHNDRCDLFVNYYGVNYPWEIEFTENTGQNVMTLRSVEYQLESYVYKGNLYNACADDKWHDLDFNFDEAIIYNSEQVSGLLKLNITPKEDPHAALAYPIVGLNDINILYSKEEQKYRFNQFWDITKDRGEFSNFEQSIFNTQLNGYIRDLNLINLDYQKESLQRKKFRHYFNKIILRRTNSQNRKMLLKIANSKINLSVR